MLKGAQRFTLGTFFNYIDLSEQFTAQAEPRR